MTLLALWLTIEAGLKDRLTQRWDDLTKRELEGGLYLSYAPASYARKDTLPVKYVERNPPGNLYPPDRQV